MSAPIFKQEILPGTDGVPGTILHVAQQKGALHVWYLADGGWTDIEVVPTGGVPTYPNYIGTAHDVYYRLVFHVFAR